MDCWRGKVAIVTGASAGIGAATAKSLVEHGVKVVGVARRMDKLEEVARTLGKDNFYPLQCDVRKEEDIEKVFKWIEAELGGADILVNNAGVAASTSIMQGSTESHRAVIETNLIAPAIFAREFAKSVKQRHVSGHIININSIAGRFAETLRPPHGMSPASKYGLAALGTELRHEFISAGLRIKVTNISPGAVLTDMIRVLSDDVEKKMPILKDKDIADAIIYALGTPKTVEIHEITVMPQGAHVGFTNDDIKRIKQSKI